MESDTEDSDCSDSANCEDSDITADGAPLVNPRNAALILPSISESEAKGGVGEILGVEGTFLAPFVLEPFSQTANAVF